MFLCVCLLAHVCEKGLEGVARKQGKHKQKIWLKVSSNGLKIVDERTGVSQLTDNSNVAHNFCCIGDIGLGCEGAVS